MSDEHVWTYDYKNDGNGFFCEWWSILRDGDKIGTVTTSEDDAKMICTLLNAAERLNVFDAQYGAMCIDIVSEGHGESDKGTKAEKSLRAYAYIREGE